MNHIREHEDSASSGAGRNELVTVFVGPLAEVYEDGFT